MNIVQRIGVEYENERLDALIEYAKKYKNSFNAVWLNTEYGFPTLQKHRSVAERLAVSAATLQRAGIKVSMQLSNSIGHGQYMAARDCSGLVYDGSPARRMVGHDGSEAKYAFCWNDKYFRDYLTEEVRIYVSAVKPDELWIDDDFRARNHAPVSFGCFCTDCISRFNKKHGTDLTREALVDEYLHGDIEVRKRYIEFIREGLASLMTDICKAAVESHPQIRVALQNGPNGPYTGYGHGYIFDAIYKATGKAPMYRPGGGAYNDHDPNSLVYKIYYLAYQMAMLPPYIKEICPEIENAPDTALGKSMHGTALETAMNLANGATDISYAMMGSLPEPLSFYEKGYKLFSEQYDYWQRLSEVSAISRSDGLCYAFPKLAHLRPLPKGASMQDFNRQEFECANVLIRTGIPITYTDSRVYLLHPHAADQMTDGELKDLLSKNVITDAMTVELIQARGIDMGFEMLEPTEFESLMISETYTDHPLNKGYNNTYKAGLFSLGLSTCRFMTRIPENSEILGIYTPTDLYPKKTDAPNAPCGYASLITETAEGGKWAVMAHGLWKGTPHTTQRNRILNIADALSGGLSARIMSPSQAVLMSRVGEDGKTLAVSVTNCTIGRADDIKIKIRSPRSEHFTFISQYDGEQELSPEITDDGYVLTLPPLTGWSVGTVFCY